MATSSHHGIADDPRTLGWVEAGQVPDLLVRLGIRRLLRRRLKDIDAHDPEAAAEQAQAFIESTRVAPIAPGSAHANEQHYEVSPVFFGLVLGAQRKYSCGWWGAGVRDLDAAEEAALAITAERAGLADGQEILELGCGWGALSLWMATRFPRARITALSNSHSQRRHIEAEAQRRGLRNLTVYTRDVAQFDTDTRFDRVVSVEMFEHLRNWEQAFARVAGWLKPGGRFFLHAFVHRCTPYPFEDRRADDWMSRHFFAGGMMPSDDMALQFQQHLVLQQRWRWSGLHYQRTAEAWLRRMDEQRDLVDAELARAYPPEATALWRQRWRLFFMAVAEMFGHDGGREWFVGHYLFEKR